MKKRLLSALLALVMVLALLPVSVFADEADTPTEVTTPAAVEDENPAAPADETEVTPPAQTPVTSRSVTTFADGATYSGGQATWATSINETLWPTGLVDVTDLPCWVVRSKNQVTVDGKKVYTYAVANSGYVTSTGASGTWYSSLTEIASNKGQDYAVNNVTAINASGTIVIPENITSLTMELSDYPISSATGSVSLTLGAKLTTLSIKNSKATGIKPAVSFTATGKLTSLTLENVDGSGITGFGNTAGSDYGTSLAHTLTLKNSVFGVVNLVGNGVNNKGVAQKANQTLSVSGQSTVGNITLTGGTCNVTLEDTTVNGGTGTLTVTSNGGAINIKGKSTVGAVTLGILTDKQTRYPTITIDGSATVGSISEANPALTPIPTTMVNINSGENHVATGGSESITLRNSTVNVKAGEVGDVNLTGGSLNVTGTYITVGDVTLAGEASLSVSGSWNENQGNSGSHNTVGGITAPKGTKLTITNDPTNVYGAAIANLPAYTSGNVMGGTWLGPVNPDALHSSLVYYIEDHTVNDSQPTYTYYTSAQLGTALNAQQEKPTTRVLKVTGSPYTDANTGEIHFMNGSVLWGVLKVTGREPIVLPSSINNVKLSNWYDGNVTYPVGGTYTAPKALEMTNDGTSDNNNIPYVELNGSGGVNTGDATKLLNVSVVSDSGEASNVRASLGGTVISLTGAVNKGSSDIKLKLTTDAMTKKDSKDYPVELEVWVTYNSVTGSLLFTNQDTNAWPKGMTLEADATGLAVLRLSNGTKYTLNGSGLKVRSSIRVAGYDTAYNAYPGGHYEVGWANTGTYSYMEVTVNVPTLRTDLDKKVVIDLLTSDSAQFDWANSPAMKQAINAVLAGITETQVDQWLSQTKREAYTKLHTGAKYETALGDLTGYSEVWMVPYLAINVTGYSTNGTMTFTAVPSYRIEVRQDTSSYGNGYSNAFYDSKKTETYQNTPYVKVVKAGASLGALTGEIGKDNSKYDKTDALTGLKLTFGTGFTSFVTANETYMHQDNTFAYKYDSTGPHFDVSHAGNSLGTMVISKSAPLVTLYASCTADSDGKITGLGAVLGYYSTLQAAVDDAKNNQHINVDKSYTGSMSVSVTGNARKFTVQGNGLNVVAANATNGLVDLNGTGGLYTVQLNRDSTAVVDATTATIAVNTVLNGSATVSATTAKSGTTVTVTCAPAVGYRTNNVSVSAHMTATNTNSAVSVTKVSDNVYSFKVPQGANSITVTPNFVLATVSSAIPFTDVATNHWAYNSVKYVYDNGLMNGVNTAGTQFGGTQTLNRAMVVTILYRAAGSPYVGTTSRFSDVANNTWYSQAVAWANQNNIVTGYTNGTFQPNWAITRQELATILYRYNTTYKGRATTGSTTLANFPDQGNVSDWATAGMQWAVGNGIVNGVTNGVTTTLSPSGSATRYEAATMLMRYGQGMGL